MVTIYDVAKRAGVSIATVSYALNNKRGIGDETKQRIKAIAIEMGFIPNSLAQGLTLKKTNIMGLVVPDIMNLYTATFIKYLEDYARIEDHYLLLGSTSNNPDVEADIVGRFISKNVDSLVILPGSHYGEEKYKVLVNSIQKRKIPFVVVNMFFPGIKANYIISDFEDGQYNLTRYLIEKGHRNFVFIGGSNESYHSRLKLNGFLKALEESDIPWNDRNYIEKSNDFTFKDGYEAAVNFLEEGKTLPDAFVAVNDMVAQGAAKALLQHNIRIPSDMSVVGNDDIGMQLTDIVPLTTLHSPIEEMARLCVRTLKEAQSGNKFTRQYMLEQELVIRRSVKDKRQN